MEKQNKKRKTLAGTASQPVTAGRLSPSTAGAQENKEQEYQRKYQVYSKALLTSYRYCDDQQALTQTLQQIFQEKLDSLKEIFSPERFKNNQAQPQDYECCLCKFFLEFAAFQPALEEEDCWAVLDWLKNNELESILAQQIGLSIMESLIGEGYQQGFKWALEQYNDNDQKLLQILTDQQLIKDIQETGNTEMIEIIHVKIREIITRIQTERRETEAKWKKLIAKEDLAASLDNQLSLSFHTNY